MSVTLASRWPHGWRQATRRPTIGPCSPKLRQRMPCGLTAHGPFRLLRLSPLNSGSSGTLHQRNSTHCPIFVCRLCWRVNPLARSCNLCATGLRNSSWHRRQILRRGTIGLLHLVPTKPQAPKPSPHCPQTLDPHPAGRCSQNMRLLLILAALTLTGCANLSEVRFGWDIKNNSLTVSMPLAKPTSTK